MKRTVLAAAVVWLAGATPARAQFAFGPIGPGYGPGFSYGGGLGFSYHRPGFRVAGFAGGYYSRSVFASPLVPFGFGPGWGFGSSWNSFSVSPPVVVVSPRVILAGNPGPADPNANPNPAGVAGGFAPNAKPADDPQPLGAKPGAFFVIEPKPKFPPPGRIAPEVGRVADRPLLPPPPKFDPFAMPIPLKAEKREADPAKEAARLMKLGREAFAAGEFGKAGEHFDRAAAADPKAAAPRFLKAQALFAAGVYADAVTEIRAGLALDPTWPGSAFDPKEPYGARAADFAAHLAELRKVIAANPGEPALQFLIGYELWFVGERAEAKKWFAAAEKGLAAPGPIALFK